MLSYGHRDGGRFRCGGVMAIADLRRQWLLKGCKLGDLNMQALLH